MAIRNSDRRYCTLTETLIVVESVPSSEPDGMASGSVFVCVLHRLTTGRPRDQNIFEVYRGTYIHMLRLE